MFIKSQHYRAQLSTTHLLWPLTPIFNLCTVWARPAGKVQTASITIWNNDSDRKMVSLKERGQSNKLCLHVWVVAVVLLSVCAWAVPVGFCPHFCFFVVFLTYHIMFFVQCVIICTVWCRISELNIFQILRWMYIKYSIQVGADLDLNMVYLY